MSDTITDLAEVFFEVQVVLVLLLPTLLSDGFLTTSSIRSFGRFPWMSSAGRSRSLPRCRPAQPPCGSCASWPFLLLCVGGQLKLNHTWELCCCLRALLLVVLLVPVRIGAPHAVLGPPPRRHPGAVPHLPGPAQPLVSPESQCPNLVSISHVFFHPILHGSSSFCTKVSPTYSLHSFSHRGTHASLDYITLSLQLVI